MEAAWGAKKGEEGCCAHDRVLLSSLRRSASFPRKCVLTRGFSTPFSPIARVRGLSRANGKEEREKKRRSKIRVVHANGTNIFPLADNLANEISLSLSLLSLSLSLSLSVILASQRVVLCDFQPPGWDKYRDSNLANKQPVDARRNETCGKG